MCRSINLKDTQWPMMVWSNDDDDCDAGNSKKIGSGGCTYEWPLLLVLIAIQLIAIQRRQQWPATMGHRDPTIHPINLIGAIVH